MKMPKFDHPVPDEPVESVSPVDARPTPMALPVLAGVAVAAHVAVQELMPDQARPDAVDLPVSDEIPGIYEYSPAGDRVRRAVFSGEASTGEVQNRFVALFTEINAAPEGTFFYYDAVGTLLLRAEMPEELIALRGKIPRAVFEPKLQEWHNENRRKLLGDEAVCPNNFKALGYPFVGASTLPRAGIAEEEEEVEPDPSEAMVDIVMQRLQENVNSGKTNPVYFKGEDRSLFELIREITKAYDVPLAIALGVGANESGYDRTAVSPADARGMYQFTQEGFEDAWKWAEAHPELSASFREGRIGNYENSWENRFVSVELFCAYYRYLTEHLRSPIERLEKRIRDHLDPSFPVGCLREIGVINAYNAGEGTIMRAIDRFLKLDNAQLKARLGQAPYGVDVWLAMLAHSFGLKDDGKSSQVGLHVFTYPQKVFALGALISEARNYMTTYDKIKLPAEDENISLNRTKGPLTIVTGFAAFLLGAAGARWLWSAREVSAPRSTLSRREVLRVIAGAFASGVAMAVPAEPIVSRLWDFPAWAKAKLAVERDAEQLEGDPAVLEAADAYLDKLYARLESDYTTEGKPSWIPSERNALNQSDISQQRLLLESEFRAMMGDELFKAFIDSKDQRTKERASLYERVAQAQEHYIEDQKKAGKLVPIAEDDPKASYFPEQVGRKSGTDNNPESLFMHKDFQWILPMMIELVNHQVDKFNANPKLYGIVDPQYPNLPHLSAVKISGALRSPLQTKAMLEGGQAGRTTKDVSAHWLGAAIDIGSYATEGGNMARLAEDFQETKGGPVKLRAGSLLPNRDFGVRAREIYSMMMGRALFALSGPLWQQKGIMLAPLWEPRQLNWHVVIKASEE